MQDQSIGIIKKVRAHPLARDALGTLLGTVLGLVRNLLNSIFR